MRHLIAAATAGAMVLLAGHAAASDGMTIAVFTKNLTNPAYQAFRIAADQIARSTGARIVHFVPKQPDNVDEQKAMVEQVLKDRPDAVIFIPVDDVAMVEPVRKLNDAHIPVILVSNPLPGQFVTYVGADDFEIGYREARYLFDHLGGKGKIVIIEGTPAAPTNREREALKEANRTSVVIGVNGILPAVKQIETGAVLASVDFNMFKIGCTATRAAVRYLRHEPLPEKIILPAEVIDNTNYKAWLIPVEQRSCPEWTDVVR
jgi:ribose transport system substrate-binding protein